MVKIDTVHYIHVPLSTYKKGDIMPLHISFEFDPSQKAVLLQQIVECGCLPNEITVRNGVISLTFVDQDMPAVFRLMSAISTVLAVNELNIRQVQELKVHSILTTSVLRALKETGHTQQQLAKATQISKGYLSKILNGQTPVTTSVATNICTGLKKLGSKELVELADQIHAQFE